MSPDRQLESNRISVQFTNIYELEDALQIMHDLQPPPPSTGRSVPVRPVSPSTARWRWARSKDAVAKAQALYARIACADYLVVPSVLLMSPTLTYDQWSGRRAEPHTSACI